MRSSRELNNRLDRFTKDRHPSVVVGIVVLATVIFILVVGSLIGSIVGVIVAFVAGAVTHAQSTPCRNQRRSATQTGHCMQVRLAKVTSRA
jgi:hypothetical protein